MSDDWKPATKKPVEIQWRGPYYDTRTVETLEGNFSVTEDYAQEGYVIIRGVDGETYPCRLDIFKETYQTHE